MMKKLEQLKQMLELQDKLNIITNGSDWTSSTDIKWLRASWIEAAELMDWCGYKWWKHTEFNKTQAHIELVDIWHFLLSQHIVDKLTPEDLLAVINEECMLNVKSTYERDKSLSELDWIEELALSCLEWGCYEDYNTIFAIVCDKVGLSFDELYRLYVGKNVLNIFRQDHGYKEGTYIKEWKSHIEPNGLIEDNIYLEMFMEEALRDKPDDIYEYLYNKLEVEYANNL